MAKIAAKVINQITGEITYARTSDGKTWLNGKGDIEAKEQVELEWRQELARYLGARR